MIVKWVCIHELVQPDFRFLRAAKHPLHTSWLWFSFGFISPRPLALLSKLRAARYRLNTHKKVVQWWMETSQCLISNSILITKRKQIGQKNTFHYFENDFIIKCIHAWEIVSKFRLTFAIYSNNESNENTNFLWEVKCFSHVTVEIERLWKTLIIFVVLLVENTFAAWRFYDLWCLIQQTLITRILLQRLQTNYDLACQY